MALKRRKGPRARPSPAPSLGEGGGSGSIRAIWLHPGSRCTPHRLSRSAAAARVLLRLQDGWRSGLDEVQRRIKSREDDSSRTAVRRALRRALGQSDAVQGLARRFCQELRQARDGHDVGRRARGRVKRFLAHAERLLRAQPGWATQEPETFEVETLDRVVSKLFRQLEEAGFRLITECDADDAFEKARRRAGVSDFVEIDAPDVEALAPFSDALIALKEVPQAETPLRAVGKIREAVDSLFACLRLAQRRQGQAAVDRRLVTARHPGDAARASEKLPSSLRRIEYYVGDHRMRGEAGFC